MQNDIDPLRPSISGKGWGHKRFIKMQASSTVLPYLNEREKSKKKEIVLENLHFLNI